MYRCLHCLGLLNNKTDRANCRRLRYREALEENMQRRGYRIGCVRQSRTVEEVYVLWASEKLKKIRGKVGLV